MAIREAWPSEPRDFTPWLAQAENMASLGSEIGIELETIQTEFGVGSFSLDILARRADTQETVVIENQFGSTDHTHLGQLITYAAGASADGSGARTVVWIAEKFKEEHRAAVDWLNRTTEPGVRFFAVELQLWRIGDSPYAPKFSVVSKPNDWQKQVTQDAAALSASEKNYVEFWDAFYDFCDQTASTLVIPRVPRKVWWITTKPSGPGCSINLNAIQRSKKLECQVWIEGYKATSYFSILRGHESELKLKLGDDLNFDEMPGKTTCKIFVTTSGDVTNKEEWPAIHQWLKTQGEAFHSAFDGLWQELAT
ncbi:MAG TPA: DUF4268 domain-containing protein [Acidobacteriaceae bacterium]